MSAAPEQTSRETQADRRAGFEVAIRAALDLDDRDYPAFMRALSAERPLDIVDRMFAPAPGIGAPIIVRPDPATAPLAERKRLLVQAWESLPEAERRAFLSRVDPRGVFIRGSS